MAYVEVDIDLDEFETYEIIDELVRRFKKVGKKGFSEEQKKSLIEDVNELNKSLGLFSTGLLVKTLDDKMKVDHLIKVWGKYNSFDIEKMLPE